MDELVHQSLGHVGLADDALLVVLADGAAQLVVVHGGTVLPEAPKSRDVSRVFDFKNTCMAGKTIGVTFVIYVKKND